MFTKKNSGSDDRTEKSEVPDPENGRADIAIPDPVKKDEEIGRRAVDSVMATRGLNQRSNFLSQVNQDSPGLSTDTGSMTVGEQVHVNGEIKDFANLEILGSFSGDLSGAGLTVGSSGDVDGNVEVETLTVIGQLHGEIKVSGHVVIRSTGRFEGQLSYGSIEVENGCQISGRLLSIAPPDSEASENSKKPIVVSPNHERRQDETGDDVDVETVFENFS